LVFVPVFWTHALALDRRGITEYGAPARTIWKALNERNTDNSTSLWLANQCPSRRVRIGAPQRSLTNRVFSGVIDRSPRRSYTGPLPPCRDCRTPRTAYSASRGVVFDAHSLEGTSQGSSSHEHHRLSPRRRHTLKNQNVYDDLDFSRNVDLGKDKSDLSLKRFYTSTKNRTD
jgi:hypothetical protein